MLRRRLGGALLRRRRPRRLSFDQEFVNQDRHGAYPKLAPKPALALNPALAPAPPEKAPGIVVPRLAEAPTEKPAPPEAAALAAKPAPLLTSMLAPAEKRGVSNPLASAAPRQSVGSVPAPLSAGPIGVFGGSG